MNRYIAFIALLLWTSISFPSKARHKAFDVPTEMQFADIRILFDAEAREMIQGRVDKFVQMGHYNNSILRAKLYFPLIEQALVRQHTPTDVKYLSLLSSYIIPSSQAPDGSVGLWLITDSLANQLGLTVNSEVDERMHVILSSESMAKHLTEKNYLLRNWIYTMMSYRMEVVDVMSEFDKSLIGASQLLVTAKTHSSILNLLAYVIAYKEKIDAPPPHALDLLTYNNTQGKSLQEIASFAKLPYEQVKNFNKWLLTDKVPTYKPFSVLLPVPKPRKDEVRLLIQASEQLTQAVLADTTKYPLLTNKIVRRYRDKSYTFAQANDLKAILAAEGDRTADMADAADLDLDKFRRFNDMSKYDDAKQRQVYYLERKNKKTEVKEHVLEVGESFWDVSQRYGVRISTLITHNRLSEKDTAKAGRVVWLKEKRPESTPVEYRQVLRNPIFMQPDNEVVRIPANTSKTEKVDASLPKNENPNNSDTSMDNDSLYVVKANETILDVYRKTNVPFDELVKINDLKTPNVYEGQQIRLKPSAIVSKVETIVNANPNFVPPTADEVANPNMTVTTSDDNVGKEQENLDEHIVRKGETLSVIAGKYKISLSDLKKWNGLNEKADIKIGQKLKLKAPTLSAKIDDLPKTDTTDITHTVIAKESLWGIAKKYGVTQEDISKINQLDEKSGIKIGQKLTIKHRTAPKSQMGSAESQTTKPVKQTDGTQQQTVAGQGTSNPQTDYQKVSEIGTNDLTKIAMPYVVNPVSSGDDIIEVNPAVDYFAHIKKRYYLDLDDIAKWNGIALEDVMEGTIPSDRRTIVVSQKGYNMSLQNGNVIYPKQEESVKPNNNNQQPTNNNNQQYNNQQPTNNNNQQQPPQTGNTGNNTSGSGETKKIPVNAFSDNFFSIKEKYALTDEDIARMNPSINIDAIKSGAIPMEVTELVVAGGGGSSVQDPIDNTGTGTQNSYVEPSTNVISTNTTSDQYIIHEVAYGDNLYKISRKYDVQMDSIYKWNNISGNTEIDKGQKLIVGKKNGRDNLPTSAVVTTPPATVVQTTPVASGETPAYHILKKGETMYGLSKTYNVPLKDLIEYNPKIFKDNMIRNGDTVYLKKPESKGTLSKSSMTDEGYYTVKEGDDMYQICEKFKIKPSDLKIWNKLAPGVGVTKPIVIGTKLVVDADLADALKNKAGEMPTSNFYDEPIYHFVQKGETLSSIAKKYKTDVDELKATNNRHDENLQEGEKLLVGKTYYHVVDKGETLTSIAQKYKISNEQLKALNNKKDDAVKDGEKLIVGK